MYKGLLNYCIVNLFLGVYPTPFEMFHEIWPELKHQFQAEQQNMYSSGLSIDNSKLTAGRYIPYLKR